jgi:hypothetical protein
MSKYTTEVRFICENFAGLEKSISYIRTLEVIEKARPKIFSFKYPIFDEKYRAVLETKILKHFYTREIGFETVGLWILKLDTLMNEIMPYYNEMYKSTLYKFNPLYNVDLHTTHELKRDKNSNEKGNIKNGDIHNISDDVDTAYSDTPQGSLSDVKNHKYLTEFTNNTQDFHETRTTISQSDINNVAKSLDQYTEYVFGKTAGKSFAQMILDFRKYIINVDIMLLNDLDELFMQIY